MTYDTEVVGCSLFCSDRNPLVFMVYVPEIDWEFSFLLFICVTEQQEISQADVDQRYSAGIRML